MYYFPQPPYFLLFVGFFAAMTCGLAFEATLKQRVQQRFKAIKDENIEQIDLRDLQTLQVSFLGICVGVCVFLAAGLEIFSFNRLLSYLVSIALTIMIGGLIWWQLGKLLVELQQGGSRALDLDGY